MKPQPFAVKSHHATRCLVLIVLWLLALVLWISLIDGGQGVSPALLGQASGRLFINALPGLLLAITLLALTRRALLSVWLAWLVLVLVYAVNALKVDFLASPLMPSDFRMIGQLQGGGGELLSSYLPHSPWPWIGIAVALLVVIALSLREPPSFTRKLIPRLLCGGFALLALVSLIMAAPAWKTVYDAGRLGLQPWSAMRTADHAGLFSSLALYRLQYANAQHKPDIAEASALIASKGAAMDAQAHLPKPATLPDIIIVQSESFFDPGILKGYAPDTFSPQLARLQRRGYSGPLHVPTFGGGTIRTEFEVLTGLSLRYFPDVQFPYLQFHEKVIPSLVRTLEKHGYSTLAIHANRPEFWNRTAAFRAIGFDRFLSIGDFPPQTPKDGRYTSDKATTDEILAQLKASGPPQFIMAISIEAHGPYDYNPDINTAQRDAIAVPPAITGEPKLELQNYIYHIRHADTELGRLADALAKRKRPSLLLFYGDHLPALVPAFQAAGFDNGQTFFDQCVPWLLIEAGLPQTPQRTAMAAWMLPGLLLERAGIHEPYFDLTQTVRHALAALTRAPDAPRALAKGDAAKIDAAMADVTWLRLRQKLAPLFAPAASTSHPPAAAKSTLPR